MKKLVMLFVCILIVCQIPIICLASTRTDYYNVKWTRKSSYCQTEITKIKSVTYTVRTRQVLASRTGATDKGNFQEVKNGDTSNIVAKDSGTTSTYTYHNSSLYDTTDWYGVSTYISGEGSVKYTRECE